MDNPKLIKLFPSQNIKQIINVTNYNELVIEYKINNIIYFRVLIWLILTYIIKLLIFISNNQFVSRDNNYTVNL